MNADIKDQPSWFGTVNMNAVNMNSVWMDTSESFVETSEGKTYPAVIGAVFDSERLAWNGFPLPRNLAVTGVELLRLVVTYKVPELLHPTRLVLNPGILHQNEQVEQLSLDLGNVSQDFSLNDTAANSLPANIQVSSSVQVSIDFSSTGQITNTLGNQFTFRLDMSLTNTDITSDQPVALRLLVVDDSGRIYSHVYDTL